MIFVVFFIFGCVVIYFLCLYDDLFIRLEMNEVLEVVLNDFFLLIFNLEIIKLEFFYLLEIVNIYKEND